MTLKQGLIKDKIERNDYKKFNISATHRKKAQEARDKINHRIKHSFSDNDSYLRTNL